MRVSLLTGFFDEQFVYREHAYANYFIKNNIDYQIITSTLTLNQKKSEVLLDTNKYNLVRKKPYFSFKDFLIFNVWKEFNDFKPDIIHLFDAQQGIALIGALYAFFHNIKIVYDHELQRIPTGKLAKLRFFILTYPILCIVTYLADKIRCVTPAGFELLKRVNPKIASKISLEPLGYEEKEINLKESTLTIPKSDNLVCLTGYFDAKKNIKPILAGFIHSNHLEAKALLLVIGPIDDSKTKNFILKNSNSIIYIDHLVSQAELEVVLFSSKINIWPKSTSTIFEALKYDNFVILPYNDQTSHLESKQLILMEEFSFIKISRVFNDLFLIDKFSDHKHFNYRVIIEKLVSDYRHLGG